jgi:hypothetical protein
MRGVADKFGGVENRFETEVDMKNAHTKRAAI